MENQLAKALLAKAKLPLPKKLDTNSSVVDEKSAGLKTGLFE